MLGATRHGVIRWHVCLWNPPIREVFPRLILVDMYKKMVAEFWFRVKQFATHVARMSNYDVTVNDGSREVFPRFLLAADMNLSKMVAEFWFRVK